MLDETRKAPPLPLPAALLSQGYRLRQETADDIPFLMALYASTRCEELQPIPWSAEQKAAFCAQQFGAQRKYYYEAIPNCRFDVIEHNDTPIGRLYLQHLQDMLRLVDIALVPDQRNHGLGSRFMQAIHDEGRASNRGINLMADKFGRAVAFYQRLGYAVIADHEVHLEMEWHPHEAH
jgi:Acetyltransferase (GNAT) family.